MLRFDIDIQAADAPSRTITGLALPYGETATLNGKPYTFQPGSLRAARDRTPLLLGHDTNQPVGVLASLADTDAGVVATFRVDAGAQGDQALAQAASGSRGGLSIGAEVVKASEATDGTTVVAEALLYEVSLCAVQAFRSAEVHAVTAEADLATNDADNDGDNPDPDDVPGDTDTSEEDTNMNDDTTTEVQAQAGPIVLAEKPRPELSLDGYIQASIRAERGDRAAADLIQAALSPTATTDVPGLLPPAYIQDIQGRKLRDRIIAECVTRRAMPATGAKIIRPSITTGPDGSKLTNLDGIAPSNAVVIGSQEIAVSEWAWGGAVSISVVERGVPNFIELAAEEAVSDYYLDVEKSLAGLLASNVGSTAGQKATSLGDGIAKVYSLAHVPADTIVASPGTWGKMLDMAGALTFSQGSISGNPLAGNIFGLRAVCSPNVTPGKAYAFASSTVELWETPQLRITATNVGALQLEIGVVGFFAEATKAGSVVEITLA